MDITLHRRMSVLVLSVALAVVVAVVLPRATSAAPPNNGEPPDAVNSSLITVDSCGFPVRIDISGKAKTVELPGGRTIVTSPGARATLTNLDKPANQVSYLITGAYHQTELANSETDDESDGDVVEVVTTGRVLLFGSSSVILAIGRG